MKYRYVFFYPLIKIKGNERISCGTGNMFGNWITESCDSVNAYLHIQIMYIRMLAIRVKHGFDEYRGEEKLRGFYKIF